MSSEFFFYINIHETEFLKENNVLIFFKIKDMEKKKNVLYEYNEMCS
jgi:hypothetical protein